MNEVRFLDSDSRIENSSERTYSFIDWDWDTSDFFFEFVRGGKAMFGAGGGYITLAEVLFT